MTDSLTRPRPSPASEGVARLGPPRELHFAGPDPARDLPGHVSAASALRRWSGQLVITQDDVNALAFVEDLDRPATPLVLPRSGPSPEGGRRQFSDRLGNKEYKMDLEALAVLPDGRLVAFGSGSTPAREQIVVVDQAREYRIVDGAALYAELRSRPDFAGSELNIEGSVVVGDRLHLVQRGNGAVVDDRAPVDAIGDLDVEAFVRWLDGASPTPSLIAVRAFDLGVTEGVRFSFTDAAALPDGRLVFLAVAEDSPDTFRDGEVVGVRVGLIEAERVVMAEIVDEAGAPSRLKLEGVEPSRIGEDGTLELLVVADVDDPDVPSVIATLTWRP